MKRNIVLARLGETGIRQEAEKVVPINGAPVPLPYHVVRVDEVEDGDDLGRVRIKTLSWAVALFTKNKDFALECKILDALQGCGPVAVDHYHEGTPYQTIFSFTTREVINHERV